MLAHYGTWLYRSRILILLLGLLATTAAVIYGIGVFGVLKSGGFTVPGSDSAQVAQLLDGSLTTANSDVVVVLQTDPYQVTDPTVSAAIAQWVATVQARPEVAEVISYANTHSPTLLAQNGAATAVILRLKTPTDGTTKDDAFASLQPTLLAAPPGMQVLIGGPLATTRQLNQQIGADLARAESITLPIVLVLLVVVFGSVIAALVPLLIGGVAIFGAFALVHALGLVTDVTTFATNVMTFMGLGLAIDYALLIITRFREELVATHQDVAQALSRTMATAGRTVLFSGLTVSISLLALLFFPEFFLRSMGLAASLAVVAAMLAALTILPAVLAVLGPRVNWLALRRQVRLSQPVDDAQRPWFRLAQGVMRFAVPIVIIGAAGLLLLGSPFLQARFANPDARALPSDAGAYRVAALANDFPQQGHASLALVVQAPTAILSASSLANLQTYVQHVQALPGVVSIESLVTVDPTIPLAAYQQSYSHRGANPQLDAVAARLAHDTLTLVTVHIQPEDFSAAAQTLVQQIRNLPGVGNQQVLVGGATANLVDLLANLRALLPWVGLGLAAATFLLLFLMTGSLVMPLKTLIVNTLSLSATFGILVWGFQEGHLSSLLGFTVTHTLDASQPVLIFALAFGLSMDYEVFLLSRIKERYDATGDNTLAVAQGMARTGALITSAALLLAVVVGAFASSRIVFIQEIGVGVAVAVLVDAAIMQVFIVPATMRLLGRANWWAPRPLQRLAARVGLGESSTP